MVCKTYVCIKYIVVIISLSLLFASQITQIYAQELRLTIDPHYQEIIVKPGVTAPFSFTVINEKDPVTIRLGIRSLEKKVTGEGYKVVKKNHPGVSFEMKLRDNDSDIEKPVFLSRNKKLITDVHVMTEKNTKEQDYVFAFVVEAIPPQFIEGHTQVSINTIMTAPFIVRVTSDGIKKSDFKIILFDTQPSYPISFFGNKLHVFDIKQEVPYILSIRNNGKRGITLRGNIIMKGTFDKSNIYTLSPTHIFPESESNMHVELQSNRTDVVSGSGSFLSLPIGHYVISANVFATEQGTVSSNSTSFIVFPIKISIYAFIGINIIIIILHILKTKHIFAKNKQPQKIPPSQSEKYVKQSRYK